ncbi:IPT/TIG domain-containing protein [Saccharicrinis fermentans]|nr:IPT/TIG domain-containing protein [Saccharicrinis fermentans]
MKNVSLLILTLLIAFNYGCDEELVYDAIEEANPVIESFEPTSGSYGDEITIKGDHLGSANMIYFGDSLATIKYRISNNEVVAKLEKGSVSGYITVSNTVGSVSSASEFTVVYAVPTIADFTDQQVLPNSVFKIEGDNLEVVYDVYFGSSKANIVEKTDDFFLVEVPFFEEDEEPANVSLSYNNNGILEQVQSIGKISLYRILPSFSVIPNQGVTGSEIVFEGENLTLIDEMLFNGQSASFTVNDDGTELVVILGEDLFSVSASEVTVKASYFGGTQEEMLSESFEVVVPTVNYYSGIKLNPRGADGEYFLDFNTGLVYDACTDWSILVENISVMAYSSKSGYLQLRQSGNASGVVKNYKCNDSGEKLPGANSVKVSKFGVLDESIEVQKEYIDAVKNKTLTDINADVVADFGANTSDLKIYTSGTDDEDEFVPGDVIIIKQDWNGTIKYGFMEIVETYADAPENIGQASGDGSYIKFNYYFQK